MLNINSINWRGSICDGPGIRTVVFFQGCNRRCKNCHNLSTWEVGVGTDYSIEDLFELIEANTVNKRITISGGEPLLQYSELLKLIILLDENQYDIALYTGYEYEEVPYEIIMHLDYIKCGAYIDEFRTTLQYFGSDNQKFIKLR